MFVAVVRLTTVARCSECDRIFISRPRLALGSKVVIEFATLNMYGYVDRNLYLRSTIFPARMAILGSLIGTDYFLSSRP